MAELRTRIVLKNDSTTNWLTNESTVLLKGEVGVEFQVDGKTKIKIGDGIKTLAKKQRLFRLGHLMKSLKQIWRSEILQL